VVFLGRRVRRHRLRWLTGNGREPAEVAVGDLSCLGEQGGGAAREVVGHPTDEASEQLPALRLLRMDPQQILIGVGRAVRRAVRVVLPAGEHHRADDGTGGVDDRRCVCDTATVDPSLHTRCVWYS
jgi:hypothetical protein